MLFRSKKLPEELDDYKLLRQYQDAGDLQVAGVLFDRYMHLVYGVCLKYLKDRDDSQDAVMQIFEKVTQELLKHDVENFKSWLHVLTKNHCLMQLRKQQSEQRQLENIKKDATTFMEISYELHHENGKPIDEDLEALRLCIEKLKDDQKKCVTMFFLEEKSYKEIADGLGLNLSKVKSYIQNGKRNLKICIEQQHVKTE